MNLIVVNTIYNIVNLFLLFSCQLVSNAYFDLDFGKARPTRREKVDHKIKPVLIYGKLVALYLIYSFGYNM